MEWDMAALKLDMGAEMGRGWRLFRANMGMLVLAGLICTVVGALTCGILAGPLFAGLLLVLDRLIREDPVRPQAGDVFKGLDFFMQALVLSLICFVISFVLSLVPVLGHLAGLLVGSVLMWSMMRIVYRRETAVEALKAVGGDIGRGDFTMPFLFGALVSLIGGLGFVACGVGIFFTLPLSYCMLVCSYHTLYESEGGVTTEAEMLSAEPPPPDDLRL